MSITDHLLWKSRRRKDDLGLGQSGKATEKRGGFKGDGKINKAQKQSYISIKSNV